MSAQPAERWPVGSRPAAPGESATLASFAEIIGEEAALRLSMLFGGRTLYIPLTPPRHGALAIAVGLDAAQALAKRYGGVRFVIPIESGRRARIIQLRCLQGKSVAAVAKLVGCTERHVYQVQAEHRAGGGLLDHFPAIADGEQFEQVDLFSDGR